MKIQLKMSNSLKIIFPQLKCYFTLFNSNLQFVQKISSVIQSSGTITRDGGYEEYQAIYTVYFSPCYFFDFWFFFFLYFVPTITIRAPNLALRILKTNPR